MRSTHFTRVLLCASLTFAAATTLAAEPSDNLPDKSLVNAQSALRQRHTAAAIKLLQDALARFPDDRTLQVELGRAYLYDGQSIRAKATFETVLRADPTNRNAKLELAHLLAERHNYKSSNQLYRELIVVDAKDETASIGLVHSLMQQNETAEARKELRRSLPLHPNSVQLQDYEEALDGRQAFYPKHKNEDQPLNRVQVSEDYFADSGGNRGWRSAEEFDYHIFRGLSGRLNLEERALWQSGGSQARVMAGTNEFRLRLTSFLLADVGGGSVGFADGNSRALYKGEVELRPIKHLWLGGGFSRAPVYPSYYATQFNLLAEGWNAHIDWQPTHWHLNAVASKQHYSDGNLAEGAGGEVVRWIGNSHFAVGPGYHFNHLNFTQSLAHGYFSPSQYLSQLGLLGVKFRLGKVFQAEYVGGAGGESIAGSAYQLAWEAALKNRLQFGNFEVGADYSYFHLAQASGPFRANSGRLIMGYRF